MNIVVSKSLFACALIAVQALAAPGAHASVRGHHPATAAAAPIVTAPADRVGGEAHRWGAKLASAEANQFGGRQTS